MSDLLQTGLDWLKDKQQAFMSQDITYVNGVNNLSIKATIGKSTFELSDEQGFVTKLESLDFIVDAEDLEISGTAFLPVVGHQIIWVRNGVTAYFEVMDVSGEGCYRFCDSYGYQIRVHAKQIANPAGSS